MVAASTAQQRERTALRDNTSAEAVDKIINIQMPIDEKRARADFVIENDGSLAELHAKVDAFHQQLLNDISGK